MEKATTSEYINEYSTMGKEAFKELILVGKLKTRYEIVYFILNTLHRIEKSSFWYCYCEHLENGGKCIICSIPIIFNDFEKDVERNLFDVNFLFNYYTKLCHKLLELFNKRKDCIECFQGEYEFGGRDWYTGEHCSVTLSQSIWYNEQLRGARLRRQKLSIPAEFQDQERE